MRIFFSAVCQFSVKVIKFHNFFPKMFLWTRRMQSWQSFRNLFAQSWRNSRSVYGKNSKFLIFFRIVLPKKIIWTRSRMLFRQFCRNFVAQNSKRSINFLSKISFFKMFVWTRRRLFWKPSCKILFKVKK